MSINLYEVRGRKCYTKRYAAVTTAGVNVSFSDVDINECLLHFEGATAVGTLTGATHTDTAAAIITSNGTTVSIPVAKYRGETILNVKASADTINVSVVAWGD